MKPYSTLPSLEKYQSNNEAPLSQIFEKMTISNGGRSVLIDTYLPALTVALLSGTTLLETNLAISIESQKKKKMVVPFNPEILLLGIHLKEIIYNKDETVSPSITYNRTKL